MPNMLFNSRVMFNSRKFKRGFSLISMQNTSFSRRSIFWWYLWKPKVRLGNGRPLNSMNPDESFVSQNCLGSALTYLLETIITHVVAQFFKWKECHFTFLQEFNIIWGIFGYIAPTHPRHLALKQPWVGTKLLRRQNGMILDLWRIWYLF